MKIKPLYFFIAFFCCSSISIVAADTLSQLVDQYEQNCVQIEMDINTIINSNPALNYLTTGKWQNSQEWRALQASLNRSSQLESSLESYDTSKYDDRIRRAASVYRRGFTKLRDFLNNNDVSQYIPDWCPID